MSATHAPSPTDTITDGDDDRSYTAIIIGSGFGGQTAAMMLRRHGVEDFLILERRDFMGGTWRQNTYPGAAVDVQSPLYSIADEPYGWSQMFADQGELARYTDHVITKHGLDAKTVLNTRVSGVAWAEDHWDVVTAAGEAYRARFLINATGPLSTPVIPDFPGRDSFTGAAFHTNDWDHSVDLRGKRVAVIGSGASAIQVIPAIQPEVAELHVFQRTPHWVLPRPDHTFSAIERRLLSLSPVYKALRAGIYWSLESRIIGFKYSDFLLRKLAQDHALKHLAQQVPDPELRARLTPDYRIGCKRVLLSNALYPALSADNVTLHDSADGIDHIDATGIVTTQGTHIDLDVIVWSTGYDATDGLISYPVIGRDGVALADRWADFPRAYLGTSIPDFPNLFIVTGPNTGIGHTSAIFLIESQMLYIGQAIDAVLHSGARAIEVTPEAEERYTEMIHSEMDHTVWKTGGCHSWYQSRSGRVVAMFPGFSFTYRRLASAFKRGDHLLTRQPIGAQR
jgi:cation diffusion facilitator CzcD-associated flavoprotein CzcO